MIIALVVSAAGVGAAAPGPNATSIGADADADDRPADVSNWLTPNWNDPDSVDDSSSVDDRLSFVERLLTNVFSGLFDTLEQTDRSTVSDDESSTDQSDSSDEPPERDDGDADGHDEPTPSDSERDDSDADSTDADDAALEDLDGEDAGADESNEADGIQDADETDSADDSSGDEDSEERPTDDTDSAGDDTTDSSASDDGDQAIDEPTDDTDSDGDAAGDDTTDTDAAGDDADTAGDGTLDRALVEQYVHEGINEERTARGLEALEFDEDLQEIARGHSEDMAERGYFSHTDPEGNAFADRYAEHGYECRAYTDGGTYYIGGENIAYTYVDQPVQTDSGDVVEHTTERELADGLVEQWMNSDEHRENILADHWNNEGIGIAVTDDDRVYATQNFC